MGNLPCVSTFERDKCWKARGMRHVASGNQVKQAILLAFRLVPLAAGTT